MGGVKEFPDEATIYPFSGGTLRERKALSNRHFTFIFVLPFATSSCSEEIDFPSVHKKWIRAQVPHIVNCSNGKTSPTNANYRLPSLSSNESTFVANIHFVAIEIFCFTILPCNTWISSITHKCFCPLSVYLGSSVGSAQILLLALCSVISIEFWGPYGTIWDRTKLAECYSL